MYEGVGRDGSVKVDTRGDEGESEGGRASAVRSARQRARPD